jgi:hypothetical protein
MTATNKDRSGWWLVWVDESPIRDEELRSYRAVERELGELREALEVFETRDVPAFGEWEARTFGALLTEIRDLERGIADKTWFLEEIDDEMQWSGCSQVEAYRRVVAARERGSREEDRDDGESDEDAETGDFFRGGEEGAKPRGMFGDGDLPADFDVREFDSMSKRKQQEFRDNYKLMAAMYAMMSGESAPDLDELLDRERARVGGGTRSVGAAGKAAEPTAQRLKTLYRKLVRRLHPDGNTELTAREKELWHEVQAAYQDRDLERLEAVAGRVEMGAGGDAGTLPVGTLRRMTAELRRALGEMKKATNRAKRQVAWGFRRLTKKRARIEAKRREELKRTVSVARVKFRSVAAELDAIVQRAERGKRPSRRARR